MEGPSPPSSSSFVVLVGLRLRNPVLQGVLCQQLDLEAVWLDLESFFNKLGEQIKCCERRSSRRLALNAKDCCIGDVAKVFLKLQMVP